MFKRTITTALVFGAAAIAPPAIAQSAVYCQDRDTLVTALAQKYEEVLTGLGVQSAQQVLEIWSSEDTGTFTILVTRPDGKSCIVASGQHWQSVDELPQAKGITG